VCQAAFLLIENSALATHLFSLGPNPALIPTPQIMSGRSTEQDAMKDAVEMAVLSSIQHPNIVQVRPGHWRS
jgi:hypothetical protein